MQCSVTHFGTSGQDEPNVKLNLSLALLVQSSAAQHEAMVEVAKLSNHHRCLELTSKLPSGSVWKHA